MTRDMEVFSSDIFSLKKGSLSALVITDIMLFQYSKVKKRKETLLIIIKKIMIINTLKIWIIIMTHWQK